MMWFTNKPSHPSNSDAPCQLVWRLSEKYLCHARKGAKGEGGGKKNWTVTGSPGERVPKRLIRFFPAAAGPKLRRAIGEGKTSHGYIIACRWVCFDVMAPRFAEREPPQQQHPSRGKWSYSRLSLIRPVDVYIHVLYSRVERVPELS